MSIASWFKKNGPNGFGYSTTAEEVTAGMDLSGKCYLITGCNAGLGEEALRVLSLRGAKIYGAARTVGKAEAACRKHSKTAVGLECDLTEPKSIRACVERLKREGVQLDGILCNAGVMALPKLEQKFGFELQFFTNHLGHFFLVTEILGLLTKQGRVVVLSSDAHRAAPNEGVQFENLSGEKGYRPWSAYGQSKFANLLFVKYLAKRFEGTSQLALAIHPGVIKTSLGRSMPTWQQSLTFLVEPLFFKTVPQGAATEVFALVHSGATQMNGAYLKDCNPTECRKDGLDLEKARKLWDISEEAKARLY